MMINKYFISLTEALDAPTTRGLIGYIIGLVSLVFPLVWFISWSISSMELRAFAVVLMVALALVFKWGEQ